MVEVERKLFSTYVQPDEVICICSSDALHGDYDGTMWDVVC